MKTTKNDSTAEILKEFDDFFKGTKVVETPARNLNVEIVRDFFIKQLQRQREEIVKLFRDEVIGEDDIYDTSKPWTDTEKIVNRNMMNRNRLREEQRQELDKLK